MHRAKRAKVRHFSTSPQIAVVNSACANNFNRGDGHVVPAFLDGGLFDHPQVQLVMA